MSYQVDSYGNVYFSAGVSVASIPATTGTQNKVLVPGPDGRISSASISQLITQSGGNLVSSVYGRTGAVVARQGDYNTDLVTEGQALYFTNDRARKSISVTTFNTSGPATYDSTTGILNIPQYGSGLQGSYVPTSRTITINGQTADLSANRIFSIDSMVYPSAGIPLSNGTSWGTSIVNNSANWNTAFGWGDHAGLYSLLGHTHTFASLTSKPTTLSGYGITDAATSAQGANADTAYGWGDHSVEGYLTSFTETDPTVASYIKAITTTNIANWNSAFSWGNHALAGYLTSFVETDPIWTSEKINYYTKLQADARYLQSYTETDPVWTSEKANYALKTYVDTSISNLVNSAPAALNTLNELALALGNDANFSTTVTNLIGTKEPTIAAGTTAQYWRGDKTWQTLPVYTLSGLGGVPTTRTITINGTSFDLSADRSWTINSMVYPGAGIAVSTGTSWGTSIVDNSTNWNTAFTDRMKWDGGSTGLNAATGRTSLGLGSAATANTGDFATASHTHIISNVTGLQTALDGKEPTITGGTTSQYWRGDKTWQTLPIYTLAGLGGQPQLNGTGFVKASGTTITYDNSTYYLASNPSGYITGNQNITVSGDVTGSGATSIVTTIASNAVTTAKINNGAVTAAKLATFGAGEGIYWAANTDGASIIFESTGDGASGGRALSNLLIALTDNGDEGLKVTTTGAELLYVNTNQFQYKGSNVWTAASLTNLNQLTNGPGYITSYTETDTLATVVSRGASTGGGRPITLDNGGGAILVRASTGGWSMGTYYQGSSGTTLAGFGAYGGNNSLTWAWIGPGYEAPWITLNGSAVNSQVALQQGGNQVWHAGNLKVNYYQEDTSTLIPIGAYDKFVWGTGDRAAALIINDTAGARYAITAGSYDLSFYKHNSTAGTAVRAFYIDGNGTAGINNVTFETGIVSTNLTINRDLGTNDYTGTGQHNMQLRIRKASLDGGCAPRSLELGVLDNGTSIIQSNHCGVGYNTLALNPVAGTVTVNGSTIWTQGNLTNLNQLSNGPGYITGYTESDTLGSVTGRGASTGTFSTFSGGASVNTGALYFRGSSTEYITGEGWCTGHYGYNNNDGFLFYQRDAGGTARPAFHIGGYNNAAYGGYSDGDSMITLVRGDGVKTAGSANAMTGLSNSSYYINIIKRTDRTIFRDSQSLYQFNGSITLTAGDGGAGSQSTVVAIKVRGLGAYDSLELGTENNYDGVIRSYGNDIRYYAGHWRTVGSTSSENHSHYWYTSKAGSTNWSNVKMRLDHDGFLTVSGSISTTGGNLHTNRGRLAFSSTSGDANHTIYNNYLNIDGEGGWDGMKMNVYAGLRVRTGDQSSPTSVIDLTSSRTIIASGELWCGQSSSRNGGVALILNDGSLLMRASGDNYHKMWYYDGIAFATNSAHGHFRFYAESNTQRNNGTGGATLVFDINSVNGNAWASGDITAYSDVRVKTDVKVIENSIEKIKAIRGVTFLRTDAQEQDKEKRHAGVIAQEVLEVLPEVVTENAEGMYSVAYGNLVALLIEGMKEQQAQIEELKNEIKELKNK